MKIELKNVKKNYLKDKKEIEVLKDVSVTFKTGNLYAIIGKSGSGKSTLLKCIASILSIDEGTIKYDDLSISSLDDDNLSSFRNKNIGIVFQEYNLFEFLNAYENIVMPFIINGTYSFNDKELNSKAIELLRFVELEDRQNHYPSELSGGEQQRIAIARALVTNPGILLCDEPTGSIDNENSKRILELLKKISKEKCVIIVTHDNEVLKYADKIYKLEEGKLKSYEVKG